MLILALMVLAQLYLAALNATCPHEAMNSNLLGLTIANVMNENQLCITVVPLFYAVDQSVKNIPYEKNIAQLQSYCRENFPDGNVVNAGTVIDGQFVEDNILPRRNVTALVADACTVNRIAGSWHTVNQFRAYCSTVVNGTVRKRSEDCVYGTMWNTYKCSMLDNVVAPFSRIIEMIQSGRLYCLNANVDRFKFHWPSIKFDVDLCESIMRDQRMNFLCVHRAYQNCVYWKKESKCAMNYATGTCMRTVTYNVIQDRELPYGRPCPKNTSVLCDCDAIGDQVSECYNGGELMSYNGISYCKCPALVYGDRCQLAYGRYSCPFEVVIILVFAVIAIVLFIHWCVFRTSKRRMKLKIPSVPRKWRIRRNNGYILPIKKNGKHTVLSTTCYE